MGLTILLLLADLVFAASAQLLLKKGMMTLGPLDFNFNNIYVLIIGVLKNIYILLAVFLYGFSLMFWLFVISKMKLSAAYPFTALMYVLIVLGSWLIFKETIHVYQWLGVSLIVVGLVFLVKGL